MGAGGLSYRVNVKRTLVHLYTSVVEAVVDVWVNGEASDEYFTVSARGKVYLQNSTRHYS